RHTRSTRDWSSDVCSSDLVRVARQDAVVACVPPAVQVGVGLERVRERGAVVAGIPGAVPVGIILARVGDQAAVVDVLTAAVVIRSEERRGGKEWRTGGGCE